MYMNFFKNWIEYRCILNNHFLKLFSAIRIDIREKVVNNHLATLSVTDIEAWIDKNGPIPKKAIIFVWTGWDER